MGAWPETEVDPSELGLELPVVISKDFITALISLHLCQLSVNSLSMLSLEKSFQVCHVTLRLGQSTFTVLYE